MRGPNRSPVVTLVNDDPVQLNVLARILERAGLDVRAFLSAETALGAMDPENPPGIVVTDLYMPGIDGWRLCRLIRSPEFLPFNEVPVLVVSSTYAGEEPGRIASDLGAEAFLSAPVDPKLLVERVLAILAGRAVHALPRVLVVEDSRTLAGILMKSFNANGYQTDTASTVEQAVAAFEKTAYDVAVLDYHLPDGLGDTLLDTFQNLRPTCVCLMMTTDPSPELALDWMKRGAADYLRKPFQVDFLVERCARARRERALLRVQDMLEQRTRELRESETRMRALLNAMPDLLFTLDADGAVVDCHAADASLLFKAREAFLGRPLREILPADLAETTLAHMDEIRQEGETGSFCYESWMGEEKRFYECRMVPCTGGQILAMVRDITDRKRAEAEGEALQAQLLQAQKMESVGRLAGGVAHDFNNMLCVILGLGDLLLSRTDPSHPSQGPLQEIRKAAERSANLTRQLLAFARQQTIAPRILDLNATVEEMLRMLRRLIGEHIQLTWTPDPGLWRVKVDPSQIDQILANLCVNSRDAIPDVGRIHISTQNRIVADADCLERPGLVPGDYVLLTVSDDGQGMDDATRKLIFEPFFTTKEVGKGTGLGLATVYGIVKQNRGWIGVASELGQGTTLTVYLPRGLGPAEPDRREAPGPKPAQGHETILLVEDEPAILAMASEMLQDLGHRVLPAGTPAAALGLAEAHPDRIDLILADLVLPRMNGRDLARALRVRHPEARTLFMSGYASGDPRDAAVRDDGALFLQKPFSMKDLELKVRKALASS